MPRDLTAHFQEIVALRDAETPVPAHVLEQLTSILGQVEASDAYNAHFARVQREMEACINGTGDFPGIFETYKTMSHDEKIAWLQGYANKLAAFQAEIGLSFNAPVIEAVHWGAKGDRARMGFDPDWDGPGEQNIFFNVDLDELCDCPAEALDAVLHEGWHHFNNMLCREVKFGRLKDDHPLYHDALYFKTQWDHQAFIKVEPAYPAQLDERFAAAFGRAVKSFVQNLKRMTAPASAGFQTGTGFKI